MSDLRLSLGNISLSKILNNDGVDFLSIILWNGDSLLRESQRILPSNGSEQNSL